MACLTQAIINVMLINQTTKYALRILIEMASNSGQSYSARTLHQKLQIPQRYLMRLLTDLSKRKYILSQRGRNGGFVLAKNMDTVYLSDVIEDFEGLKKFEVCFFGNVNCSRQHVSPCAMHEPWRKAWKEINKALHENTIGKMYEASPELIHSITS